MRNSRELGSFRRELGSSNGLVVGIWEVMIGNWEVRLVLFSGFGKEDDPVGPDDMVTVANVHRVVSHEMLFEVFPEEVMVGNNRRLFRELARMSHIRIMTDCQSVPMVEAVAEGHYVYYREDNARRGTPTIERRTGFEFTLAFAKLCYARGVLRREVDFSRNVDAGGDST
ncbi:hypothetical protein R1sor_003149 [Riccia sorocarpa]|uniref:Uncharacterized protein n=1 Tax=Riccia sorocarpa TaxID=122646 RepID=A0ABD3H0R7_9MARC